MYIMCITYIICRYVPMLLNFMDEMQDVEELDHEAMQQHQHHLRQIKHATHHMRPSNIHLVNHVCVILQVCMHLCTCVPLSVYMCACVCVYMSVSVCTCVYTSVCTYVPVYIM